MVCGWEEDVFSLMEDDVYIVIFFFENVVLGLIEVLICVEDVILLFGFEVFDILLSILFLIFDEWKKCLVVV